MEEGKAPLGAVADGPAALVTAGVRVKPQARLVKEVFIRSRPTGRYLCAEKDGTVFVLDKSFSPPLSEAWQLSLSPLANSSPDYRSDSPKVDESATQLVYTLKAHHGRVLAAAEDGVVAANAPPFLSKLAIIPSNDSVNNDVEQRQKTEQQIKATTWVWTRLKNRKGVWLLMNAKTGEYLACPPPEDPLAIVFTHATEPSLIASSASPVSKQKKQQQEEDDYVVVGNKEPEPSCEWLVVTVRKRLCLQYRALGKYLCAERQLGGALGQVIADRDHPGPWEVWTMERSSPIQLDQLFLRSCHGLYLTVDKKQKQVLAHTELPFCPESQWKRFKITKNVWALKSMATERWLRVNEQGVLVCEDKHPTAAHYWNVVFY
ncbi:hypothetical protein QOT17_023937 [Balamuthia mandrillaris]